MSIIIKLFGWITFAAGMVLPALAVIALLGTSGLDFRLPREMNDLLGTLGIGAGAATVVILAILISSPLLLSGAMLVTFGRMYDVLKDIRSELRGSRR